MLSSKFISPENNLSLSLFDSNSYTSSPSESSEVCMTRRHVSVPAAPFTTYPDTESTTDLRLRDPIMRMRQQGKHSCRLIYTNSKFIPLHYLVIGCRLITW